MQIQSYRAALAGLALTAVALVGPAASRPYDDDVDARLNRIEQELRDLQDQMYQTGGPAAGGAGPSMQRLNDLEQSIRTLTGQVEQLSHDVRTVREKVDRLETETNFRLNQLEGNPNGPPPSAAGPAPGGTASDDPSPPPGVEPGRATGGGGPRPPGTIGDIPEAQPGSSAEALYNQAMDLLTKAEYDGALGLFKQVVRDYPETDYAAQAQYWIADIHYVQKNYESAALAFADVLKKYPQSGRGPEAMLKLGLSLINIGKTKEGCTALGAIKQKYPKASDAILSRAEREAKKAGCSS
jgi:tol-pal system protein YbgF